MGCGRNRRKQTREFSDQKWEYINLQDFKAGGCGAGFAYGFLWFSLILSIAVYAVDSFTAVQLLAFNRWSSAIQPAISFDVSKWIFSGCILMSFINLGYEAIRASRVMKRGNIAECYMDSLAARWESIRVGGGQGWRRFLVFASLTKSKKGAEYIALFTYFSFQAWIRVLVCSAPRQVINAFTLKSVYQAHLSTNAHNVGDGFTGFFDKVKKLAEEDYRQAAILSGMAFTFVIWVFSVIYLLLAVLFYVFFLFHWIPRADGGLTGYCERKVNKALLKIVTKKVNKALAKNQAKAAKMYGEKQFHLERAATLPDVGPVKEDKLPQMPALDRADTNATLPPYAATRAGSPGDIEMSPIDNSRQGYGVRPGTAASNGTYGANASLLGGAADMGYTRDGSPAPSMPGSDMYNTPPQRPGTAHSQRSGYSQHTPVGPPYGSQPGGYARPGMGRPREYGMPPRNLNGATSPPGPGIIRNGTPVAATIPDVSLDPSHAPGHEASHYLGAPTLPDVAFGGGGSTTHDKEMTGLSREPMLPELNFGSSPPQRPGTSNSQRSLTSTRPLGRPMESAGPTFTDTITESPELTSTPVMAGLNGPRRTESPQYYGANSQSSPPQQRQYEAYNPHGYSAATSAGNPFDADGFSTRGNTPAGTPSLGGDWAPTRTTVSPSPAQRQPQPHQMPPQRAMTGPMPYGHQPGTNRGHNFQPPERSGTAQDMRQPTRYNAPGATGRSRSPGGSQQQLLQQQRQQYRDHYGYDVESQPRQW